VSADATSGVTPDATSQSHQFRISAEAVALYLRNYPGQAHQGGLPVYASHDYANFCAHERGCRCLARCGAETLAPFLEGLATKPPTMNRPLAARAVAQVAVSTGEPEPEAAGECRSPAFNALSAIGIQPG